MQQMCSLQVKLPPPTYHYCWIIKRYIIKCDEQFKIINLAKRHVCQFLLLTKTLNTNSTKQEICWNLFFICSVWWMTRTVCLLALCFLSHRRQLRLDVAGCTSLWRSGTRRPSSSTSGVAPLTSRTRRDGVCTRSTRSTYSRCLPSRQWQTVFNKWGLLQISSMLLIVLLSINNDWDYIGNVLVNKVYRLRMKIKGRLVPVKNINSHVSGASLGL